MFKWKKYSSNELKNSLSEKKIFQIKNDKKTVQINMKMVQIK